MLHRKIIQNVTDYIEDNLKTELLVHELAQMAGYSVYYFYKVFRQIAGMSVKQYINRRRMLHAVYDICCGKNATDVAYEYGFDTYSGFYKAFLREFSCSPSDFFSGITPKKPYRINFSEEEYIMVTHKKAYEVLSHYENLLNVTLSDIYYKGTGIRNENAFYVGDKYVLKFTNNFGKVLNNISFAKALSAYGISSSTPILSVSGDEYIQDGELYFYLTDRIPGSQVIPENLYNEDYFPDCEYIGKLIGELHSVLATLEIPFDEVNIFDKVTDRMTVASAMLGLSEEYCREFLNKFAQIYAVLPVQIIHRDPNPGNIIGKEDSWGFIDFELSEKNVRIFDICYAATAVLSETFDENDPEMADKWFGVYYSLVRGYDSVSVLTDSEKEALPYVIIANQIISVAWFAGKDKYADIFEVNKKMTLWLMGNFDKLKI